MAETKIAPPTAAPPSAGARPAAPPAAAQHQPAAPAGAGGQAPSKPAPPPPAGRPGVQPRRIGDMPPEGRVFKVSGGVDVRRRAVVYGPPGIGKSSLAAMAPNPIVLDLQDETKHIKVERVGDGQIATWDDLRLAVRTRSVWDAFSTVVVDNVTKAQQLAAEWTCRNVLDPKTGKAVDSIDAYAYGVGSGLHADTFRLLLQDFDEILRAGKFLVLVAHSTTDRVSNPRGEDFIRFEPDLFHPKSGKSTSSIRNAVVQWADHVLGIFYDVHVDKDSNVGLGSGTRTIYTSELPGHTAKARFPADVDARNIEYVRNDPTIWRMLGWLN